MYVLFLGLRTPGSRSGPLRPLDLVELLKRLPVGSRYAELCKRLSYEGRRPTYIKASKEDDWMFLISLSQKWSTFIRMGDKEKGEKIKNDSKRHSKSIRYLRTNDAVMRYPGRKLLHSPSVPVFHYSITPIPYYIIINYGLNQVRSINPIAGYCQ